MKWAIASILAAVTLVVLSESIGGQEMPTMGNGDVRIISFERLRYPSAALAEFAQGVVVVRANLDRDGAVAEASAVSGSALLAPAAVENVKRWRFEPNTQRTAVVVYNFSVAFRRVPERHRSVHASGPELRHGDRLRSPGGDHDAEGSSG